MLLNATSQLVLKSNVGDHSVPHQIAKRDGKSESSSSSGASFHTGVKGMGKKQQNRQAINTLVLNESASGVNKEELEQEEVRPTNFNNMRSFFP